MLTFDVNWLAILVCTVLNMIIGAVWFGVFAEPWMKGIGRTKEDIEASPKGASYGIAVANSLVTAFVLANVIQWAGVSGLVGGLCTGVLMWIGFTGLSMGVNHAFEGRSTQLWFINACTYLVGLMVMGAVLGVWQ